jgi:photosystem II stability/assembly factor-like uncharacterized protein
VTPQPAGEGDGQIGGPETFQVDPLNPGTILLQMHKGGNGSHSSTDGLYKSTDCGSTWNKLPPGQNASDPGVNIHSGSLTSIIMDPIDSNIVYTVSNYGPGGVFKSLNGGIDWTQVVPSDVGQYVNELWFNALTIDPTNHLRLVAVNHDGCSGPYAPNCIAETRDAGQTWTLIKAPVEWSEGNGVRIIDDSRMLFSSFENGLYLTTDKGVSWTKVAGGAGGAGNGDPMYQAMDGTYYLGTAYGVLGSKDLTTWTSVLDGTYLQLTGTGVTMVVSSYFMDSFFVAAESAPQTWTQAKVATVASSVGAPFMTFEPTHHLVYSSNFTNFRRVVLP